MHLSPKAAVGTWQRAKEFADAAQLVCGRSDMFSQPMVAYFLFSHSIELSLKSFLIGQCVPENELRRLGHDLERSLCRASSFTNFQVILSKEDRAVITELNPYYQGKRFEYLYTGFASFPILGDVQATCLSILEQTESLANRAACHAIAEEGNA